MLAMLPLSMTRTSKPPYCCPRCGYETSRKDLTTRHFTTLKQPCPALSGDIVIVYAIKDYVLANRIYRPTATRSPPSIVYDIIYICKFMMGNEPVYKLCKTTQDGANGGLKESMLLLHCRDCTLVEQELMAVFKAKYQQATEYGLEYFKGDIEDMMDDMYATVRRLDRVAKLPVERGAEHVEAQDASQ